MNDLSHAMRRAHATPGITPVAKIEKGAVWNGHTHRSLPHGRSWKAQWRYRTTDPWSFVTDSNHLHIEYATPEAAIKAAIRVLNQPRYS